MDTAALDRLKKLHALTDSPHKGEKDNAIKARDALLKKHGKVVGDIPALVNPPPPTAFNFADMFSKFEDDMERKQPGYKAERAAEAAKRAKATRDLADGLIAKHGSKKAAAAPNAMEKAVNDAVKPFLRLTMKKYFNGTFKVEALDDYFHFSDPVSDRVAAAVRSALPLPTTIAEAKAEYDAWRYRDKELNAIWGSGPDTYLSLGCTIRETFVRNMLHYELRAVIIQDAKARLVAIKETQCDPGVKETDAMIADLEHLSRIRQLDQRMGVRFAKAIDS